MMNPFREKEEDQHGANGEEHQNSVHKRVYIREKGFIARSETRDTIHLDICIGS